MLIRLTQFTALHGSLFVAFAAVAAPEFVAPAELADELVAIEPGEEDAQDELAAEAVADPDDLEWATAEGVEVRRHQGGHKPPGQAPECKKDKGQNEPDKCPGPF
jgi:hypothetical protein